jgi:ornithine carbamoyltransferase
LTAIKVAAAGRTTFAVVKSELSIPSARVSLGEPLAAAGILALFAAARRLQADAHAGTVGKPLHGKNLALLLGRSPCGETSALHRAAQELGARVAEVRFAEPAGTTARDDVRDLARMLGRMYDAIDCGTLAPATVRQIEQEAGVPVYEGLALDDHPARVLADLMTLYEHRPAPASSSSILYLGDARTMRGRAFLTAARAIGFEVHLGQHTRLASNDATFVVDATHHPYWTLHSSPGLLSEARRSETHRRVMQAVLLDTIAKA